MKRAAIYAIVAGACVLFAVGVYVYSTQGQGIVGMGSLDRTYVSLRFDDGWKSQLNAYESLNRYGLTGSIYIISGFMGQEGYMDWADVERISGVMEIGGHTASHADLRNLPTVADYEREIGDDYRALVDRGFDVQTFVYPYGNYSLTAVRVVKRYYICASTQDVGVNSNRTDLYRLRDFTVRSNSSLEDVKRSVRPKSWAILTFHDIGEPHETAGSVVKANAVSIEFFEQILQWLVESDVQVITVAQGCEMLREWQRK
jgi:peptidoglycan/xylan/chitin deacetylase (PgdA/CDA1 family)